MEFVAGAYLIGLVIAILAPAYLFAWLGRTEE